jgi:hypothetical protein
MEYQNSMFQKANENYAFRSFAVTYSELSGIMIRNNF